MTGMTEAYKLGYKKGQQDKLRGFKNEALYYGVGYFETAADCEYSQGYRQGWNHAQ